MEVSKKTTIPTWIWIFPVLFGLPGGIVTWIIFRKRDSSVWLILVGVITSILSNMLVQKIYF